MNASANEFVQETDKSENEPNATTKLQRRRLIEDIAENKRLRAEMNEYEELT